MSVWQNTVVAAGRNALILAWGRSDWKNRCRFHRDIRLAARLTDTGTNFALARPFCEKDHVFPLSKHAAERKPELQLV
jgi:hypothetical protein